MPLSHPALAPCLTGPAGPRLAPRDWEEDPSPTPRRIGGSAIVLPQSMSVVSIP